MKALITSGFVFAALGCNVNDVDKNTLESESKAKEEVASQVADVPAVDLKNFSWSDIEGEWNTENSQIKIDSGLVVLGYSDSGNVVMQDKSKADSYKPAGNESSVWGPAVIEDSVIKIQKSYRDHDAISLVYFLAIPTIFEENHKEFITYKKTRLPYGMEYQEFPYPHNINIETDWIDSDSYFRMCKFIYKDETSIPIDSIVNCPSLLYTEKDGEFQKISVSYSTNKQIAQISTSTKEWNKYSLKVDTTKIETISKETFIKETSIIDHDGSYYEIYETYEVDLRE